MLKIFFHQNNQKGFALFYVTILVLAIIIASGMNVSVLTYNQQKIFQNIVKSTQAYYAAEAGLEDALLRLENDMNWSSQYSLDVGSASIIIDISDEIGSSRTITSEGNSSDRIRRLEVTYEIHSEETSFHYGAQVGEGGIIMDDGSVIYGNVYSNGNITAAANTEITKTTKVTKSGNKIQGATIGQNAYVDICQDSDIGGTLIVSNNINCTAANIEILTDEIPVLPMPITQEQIDEWKNQALSGGTISEYNLSGMQIDYLGPKKIDGIMTVQDNAQLYMTGTIWVTGRITIQNNAQVKLDQAAYGSLSGVIITDDIVVLQDSGKALGSGLEGSYLLIISTDSSDSAIEIKNSFEADILYTQNGWITVQDTADVREVTGYGIHLKNDAEIIYETGLRDAAFTGGPSGAWQVTSWKEIE